VLVSFQGLVGADVWIFPSQTTGPRSRSLVPDVLPPIIGRPLLLPGLLRVKTVSLLLLLMLTLVVWTPSQATVPTADFTPVRPEIVVEMQLLGEGQQTPARRAQLVEQLSDPSLALSPEELSRLFYVGGDHNALIDGARIAEARRDPALIPLMFEGFLNSKVTRSTFDPDIFERLLRGLQAFPIEEVRARLVGADLSFVVQAAYERLDFEWVQPLASGQDGIKLSSLDPLHAAAAERATRRWLAEVLSNHSFGLTRLQTDSGDITFDLFRRIEAQHLAVMIETGSAEEARLGLEVAVQRQLGTREVRQAVEARLAAGDNPELSALRQRLKSPRFNPHKLYPVGPLDVAPVQQDWQLEIPRVWPIPLWVFLCAVPLAWILLCLLAVRAWPRTKPLLFPLAALAVAALLLLSLEGFLGLVSFKPLMDVRPAFNPNRAPPVLFTTEQKGGETFVVNMEGNSRQLAFLKEKKDDVLRVVTLGESSVHGTHYLAEEAFAAVLEQRLDELFPEQRVEVINAGVGGSLSDEIVHYAAETHDFDPDLLVLYFGNNDLADLMRLASFRAWTPSSVALRFVLDRIRIVRLLSSLLPDRARGRIVSGGSWLDDEGLSNGEMRFLRRLSELNLRVNMERIVRSADRAGIPTLIALQAQNDDMCGLTDENDPSFHSGCFQQPLRRVARKVGANTGAVVVDVPEAMRLHARAGQGHQDVGEEGSGGPRGDGAELVREGAGHDYFYDTCHPTRLGHRLIGEILAPVSAGLITDR